MKTLNIIKLLNISDDKQTRRKLDKVEIVQKRNAHFSVTEEQLATFANFTWNALIPLAVMLTTMPKGVTKPVGY